MDFWGFSCCGKDGMKVATPATTEVAGNTGTDRRFSKERPSGFRPSGEVPFGMLPEQQLEGGAFNRRGGSKEQQRRGSKDVKHGHWSQELDSRPWCAPLYQASVADGTVTAAETQSAKNSVAQGRALLQACARGDLTAVSKLMDESQVSSGVSLVRTARDMYGYQALHFACASGSLKLVMKLCEGPHFADATAQFQPIATRPLAIAASHGHLLIVEYLVHFHNALSRDSDVRQWSPLLKKKPHLFEPQFSSEATDVSAAPRRSQEDTADERALVLDWLLAFLGKKHGHVEGGTSSCSTECDSNGSDRGEFSQELVQEPRAEPAKPMKPGCSSTLTLSTDDTPMQPDLDSDYPERLSQEEAAWEAMPVAGSSHFLQRARGLSMKVAPKGFSLPGRVVSTLKGFSKKTEA